MLNVSLICAVVMSMASTAGRAGVPGDVFDGRVGEILGGRVGEIIVLRHGQTEWSRSGQHTGVTDLPLLPEGEERARELRKELGGRAFAEVWVSPLQRARRTAELAGLTATGLDADLVEVDYGGYEGRTTAEISEELGRTWSIWSDGTVPGETPGETLEQVGLRVDRVLDRARPRLEDGDVALVAHGHVLRVLTARWLDLPPEAGALFALPAGAYGVLGHEHGRPVLNGWGLGRSA
jgi:broad specificity phosphatase PhoE